MSAILLLTNISDCVKSAIVRLLDLRLVAEIFKPESHRL